MIKLIKNLTRKQIIIIVSSLVVLTGIVTTTIILLNKDEEEIKKCLVEFDTNGGSTINSQEITCGNTITEPNTKPEKTGFEFLNWTYNNEEFDFNTKINENIVLIANYNKTTTEEIITVTFNTDGGSEVKPIEIIKGTTITEPVNPIKVGYVFNGWYLNENKFDFSQPINENITLTAKWIDISTTPNSAKPSGNTGNQNGNSNQGQSGGSAGNNPTNPTEPNNPTTPEKKLVYVVDADVIRTCPSGYTINGDNCIKKIEVEKRYSCSGYEPTYKELNGKCYTVWASHKIPICNGDDEYVRWKYTLEYGDLRDVCLINGSIHNRYPATFEYKCNDGAILTSDNLCLREVNYKTEYFCPDGYKMYGRECVMTSQQTKVYKCGVSVIDGKPLIMQDNKCYRYE